MFWLSRRKTIKQYKESQAAFGNPLMGYVPSAWYNEVSEDISLLYMDITWVELEPEEGVYNWASIDEENQISRWRKEGKHLVFRFVCDIPGEEALRIKVCGVRKQKNISIASIKILHLIKSMHRGSYQVLFCYKVCK